MTKNNARGPIEQTRAEDHRRALRSANELKRSASHSEEYRLSSAQNKFARLTRSSVQTQTANVMHDTKSGLMDPIRRGMTMPAMSTDGPRQKNRTSPLDHQVHQ